MNTILGIIGGFGPETTAKFQLEIIELCRTKGSLKRPEIIMWNAPIPLEIEKELILHSKNSHKFLPFLIQGAKLLEKAGATMIVLPCNTLHIFINEIRESVHVPVISIAEKAQEHLTQIGVKHVAIFGTRSILSSNIYGENLKCTGIMPMHPSNQEQEEIDMVIFNILRNTNLNNASRALKRVAYACRNRGASDILLACTDLQIVFPKLENIGVHDTMHILADACVHEILN